MTAHRSFSVPQRSLSVDLHGDQLNALQVSRRPALDRGLGVYAVEDLPSAEPRLPGEYDVPQLRRWRKPQAWARVGLRSVILLAQNLASLSAWGPLSPQYGGITERCYGCTKP